MKSNNKGFTLIESIVTVAIIAILLSMVGLAFTSIIHYMSESALIKNTSNEIFEQIQNDESTTEQESTMIFKDGLSVPGKMRTVTKKYNDKDELFLSTFKSELLPVDKPTLENKVFYYLVNNPQYVGKEVPLRINATDIVNCQQAISNQIGNALLENTRETDGQDIVNDISYIQSVLVKKPSINECLYYSILNILNSDLYLKSDMINRYNKSECEIVWYKIKKDKDNEEYQVYGYIKPKGTVFCEFDYYSGIYDSRYLFADPKSGVSKQQYDDISTFFGNQFNFKWVCSLDYVEYTALGEKIVANGAKVFEKINDQTYDINTFVRFSKKNI